MPLISQRRLKEIIHYDAVSGVFTNKITRGGVKAGSIIGGVNDRGYVKFNVDRRKYRAHRLAWLYVNGSFPVGELDHKNRDKTDNRIANLREITRSANVLNTGIRVNNTSGYTGITLSKAGRFVAHYCTKYLGTFSTLSEALTARQTAGAVYD